MFQFPTKSDRLRDEVARLHERLRALDVSETRKKIAEVERQREEDARRAREQREKDEADALERHRVRSWVAYKSQQAIAGGEIAYARFLSVPHEVFVQRQVEDGWPPGDGPENYRSVPVELTPQEDKRPDYSGTLVGAALAKKKIQI